MRQIKATLNDVYHVHKIENEYRKEVGMPLLTEKDYLKWTRLLYDESREYILLMHGKSVAGMIWGHLNDSGDFVVQGRYLKPKFRTFKFKREMVKAWLSFRSRFDTIKMWLAPNTKTRHKPLFLEVEIKKRGNK